MIVYVRRLCARGPTDTVWGKIKEKLSAKEMATIPLSVLKSLGLGVLEHYLKSKFGL